MPRIELIPETKYQALQPYHYTYDNLPLENILKRQSLINSAVDLNSDDIRKAAGNQGSLSNRLNQSIELNGDLKKVAIDDVMHNIAYHEDGAIIISGSPVNFVRMKQDERDKLDGISADATALKIKIDTTPSTTYLFEDSTIELVDSTTITWSVTNPSTIKAETVFPASAAHTHYYEIDPVQQNISSPDYINYKTTSSGQAFVSGSLKVYVNGFRLSDEAIYVPPSTGPNGTWVQRYIVSTTPASGLFSLNAALNVTDVIKIDFDVDY